MKTRASLLIAFLAALGVSNVKAAELPLVTLAWGSISAATNYTLYWGTSPRSLSPYTFSNNVAAPQTSNTQGVIPGTFIYFAVSATDSNNTQSALSPEVFYAPAPTNLVVTYPPGGGSSANVRWSPIANAASYKLAWGLQSGSYTLGQQTFAAPQTSATISGLLPNQVYYFAVSALDAGANQTTNSIEAVLPGSLSVAAGATSDAANVSWPSVANVASYELFWGSASGNYSFSNNVSGNQSSVNGLASGSTYFFAVNPVMANTSHAGFSPEFSYTVPQANTNTTPTNGPTTLNSPQNLAATPVVTNGASGVVLTWGSVANAAGYTLLWGTNSGNYTSSNSALTGTVFATTNLASTNDYYFAVQANGGAGTNSSPLSSETAFLAAPGSFSVTAQTNGGMASWNVVPGASNYVILYGAASQTYGAAASTSGAQTNLALTNLVTSNSYYMVVAAVPTNGNPGAYSAELTYNNVFTNQSGSNTNTNSSSGTTNQTTNQIAASTPTLPPCAVSVTAGPSANTAAVTWGADTDSSLASYTLFWGLGTTNNNAYSLSFSLITAKTNAIVTGLTPGQGYVFQVYAYDASHTQLNFADAVGYQNPAAPPPPPPPPATPAFPPSTNQIPGIPPLLGMNFNNQQANLVIAGTVGAQMLVQASTNICDPTSWVTIATNTLVQAATGSNTTSTNALPSLLQAAFAPALQVYTPPGQVSGAPAQFYRAFMPYDYSTLAYQVLASNYPTRLIGVLMTSQSNNVCYVTNQLNYIYCDRGFNVDVQSSPGATIRNLADSLSSVLNQNWTMAYELSYTNGGYQLLATVVQTDPGSDQVAGQQQSSGISIDF
jgi:hypothetical protein